jgi:hypothetical protein
MSISKVLFPLILTMVTSMAGARPAVRQERGLTVVEGAAYRVSFANDAMDTTLELKGRNGKWLPVTKSASGFEFTLMSGSELMGVVGLRATLAVTTTPESVVVGRQAAIDPANGRLFEIHFVCMDTGMLVGTRLVPPPAAASHEILWSPPRMTLTPGDWDSYLFLGPDGRRHAGRIADLQPFPAYAGVSPWAQQGDCAPGLDPQHPGLVVRSESHGVGLGIVFIDYAGSWAGAGCFLQRYQSSALYLYAGYADAGRSGLRWAWIAPFAPADDERRVQGLAQLGAKQIAGFQSNAPAAPAAWYRPIPDFPSALRRPAPVRSMNDAAVFSINESIGGSDYGLSLARKVGSDVLVRAWFKWAQAPPVAEWRQEPAAVHALGALLGGGITCSALYDGENGLTREQWLDMATRGPAGQLVDAWDSAGIRHGSLSSTAYQDYLFRWCREQIDAGADYLFMDEINAALSDREGYDDHSLADFRSYLREISPRTRGWAPDDARWHSLFGVALDDPAICSSGRMDSFDYRAYLRRAGALTDPSVAANRLFALWGDFRTWRDDREWKSLTDRIRAYGRKLGRTIFISGNGIARYVDLQLLGFWERWTDNAGHLDLSADRIPGFRAQVTAAQSAAGRNVPVVFFHDWGFGDIPFPWMAIPPSQREIWMRTVAAEVYASGGFFAFPVQGPFGCDAGRDGTLALMAHLTEFYQRHRDLYLHSAFLGCETVRASEPRLSLAVYRRTDQPALVVHVINRDARDGRLVPRGPIQLSLQLPAAPLAATIVSPDFEGERRIRARMAGRRLEMTIPRLEAYSLLSLRYRAMPDVSRLHDPIRMRPALRWVRPARSEFRVLADGSVENGADLEGFLQGMLHKELRNPPTFLVKAARPMRLLVHVRSVAVAGARLQFRIDGRVVRSVDLPDRDGKNDASAPEYDLTCACAIPHGRHRVTVDNVGGDWLVVEWYRFATGR